MVKLKPLKCVASLFVCNYWPLIGIALYVINTLYHSELYRILSLIALAREGLWAWNVTINVLMNRLLASQMIKSDQRFGRSCDNLLPPSFPPSLHHCQIPQETHLKSHVHSLITLSLVRERGQGGSSKGKGSWLLRLNCTLVCICCCKMCQCLWLSSKVFLVWSFSKLLRANMSLQCS